jgi:hypothetical protein
MLKDITIASMAFTFILSFIVGVVTFIFTTDINVTVEMSALTLITFLVITGILGVLEYTYSKGK